MIEYENLFKVNSLLVPNYKSLFDNFWKKGSYILGTNLFKFEKNFSKYIGTKYAIGVNSGYDALYLSLKVLNLKKNSEVIMSSCSYIAAINAVLENNLKPVFVEPDILTFNIDTNKIEQKITKKTKVILITHLYGNSCNMGEILMIKKRFNLFLIEDCAQSHGARYKTKKTGSFGDFGCFSFYPTKNLGGFGDGGLITTNNKNFFKLLNLIRNYGFKKKNYSELIGINSRLDEIQAIFLNEKLKKINIINRHKIKLAKVYDKYLTNKVIKPKFINDSSNIYHIYPIRYKSRTSLIKYLDKKGINVACHYPIAPHLQKSLKKKFNKKYPISEEIHKTVISLPISYFHNENTVKYVCKIINKFV